MPQARIKQGLHHIAWFATCPGDCLQGCCGTKSQSAPVGFSRVLPQPASPLTGPRTDARQTRSLRAQGPAASIGPRTRAATASRHALPQCLQRCRRGAPCECC